MNKEELRILYLKKRKTLANVSSLSEELCDAFFLKVDLAKVYVVHVFLPIKNKYEVDTWPIVKRLWKEYPHIKVVVPVTDFSTHSMLSVEINSESVIIENSYGIPEPPVEEVFDNKLIDLVITPLLVSDMSGYRVGYGAGFYDRFFSQNCRRDVIKIGLSFFKPVIKISNVDKFDVPLDRCIYLD